MKRKFSNSWKASVQPRKQRKYIANAPLKKKQKAMSSSLSTVLRKKYARKSFPIRVGDSVKIMRGEFKGKTGKVSNKNVSKGKITVEGIQNTKKDGTKINVLFDTSNVQINELNLDDKKRLEAINRTQNKKAEAIKKSQEKK